MIRIAIDGPSGAGKSTVAKTVAKMLGIAYVDTGALYRTIALYVNSKNVDTKDAEAVAALLPEIHLEIKYENGTQIVLLNGEDPGDAIRMPDMSLFASNVSSLAPVREFLLEIQRKIARENSVVMDGRDIGTVILPDADVKIFLTASDECRARRRYAELLAKGKPVTYESVLADMRLRDDADRNRVLAPAIAASDAVTVDNSDMSPEESAEAVIAIIKQKSKQ